MKPMFTRTAKTLSALGLLAGLASPASAALTGDYSTRQWVTANTNGGNGSVEATADQVVLTSSDFSLVDATPTESWLSYSLTVSNDTKLSFDWAYRTDDVSSTYDVFGYTVNGVFTQLSQDGLSFLDTQTGHVSVQVSAGSSFGWTLKSLDSEGGSAVVTLNGLSAGSAVSAVPEPASMILLLCGLGAMGLLGRRRSD
jgi:PEP-CTERM motif